MKIIPVNPSAPISTSDAPTQASQDARSRAIAMLSGGSPNNSQAAVPNQNSISIESLSAASPQALKTDPQALQTTQISGNNDSTEGSTPSTEATTAPKEEPPLSTQYAVLARKEKALRQKVVAQEQQLKSREAALQAKEAELQAKSTQDFSNYISKDKLKQNAFSVLSELGVNYDQISQQALAAQSPEYQTIQQLKQEMSEELQKVREEQANSRKAYAQQQAESYQQALRQIRNEASELVKSDPSFETIRETRSVNDVVTLIERTFKEQGTLLTVEQAAGLVEDQLIEEAMKISSIKKIQDRLKSASKPVAQQSAPQAQAPKTTEAAAQKLTTLTNNMTSTKQLSAKERAILAFKGQLSTK